MTQALFYIYLATNAARFELFSKMQHLKDDIKNKQTERQTQNMKAKKAALDMIFKKNKSEEPSKGRLELEYLNMDKGIF